MAEKFGERLRRVRLERKIGLREAATKVGISATYLSRIETNEERNPPKEEHIRALAKLLDDDFDLLMTLADRIEDDIHNVVTSEPGWPEFLRTARSQGVSSQDALKALELLHAFKGKKGGH